MIDNIKLAKIVEQGQIFNSGWFKSRVRADQRADYRKKLLPFPGQVYA